MNNNWSDQDLIKSSLAGDDQAIKNLLNRYLKAVYNFVFQYVGDTARAEDLTQEVMIKVWKNLAKYNLERPFKPWLFKIARNQVLDSFKAKQMLNFSELEGGDEKGNVVEDIPDSVDLPDELLVKKELIEVIDRVLGTLAVRERLVIQLYYFNDLNLREISEVLGQSINTVKSRLKRSLEKISAELHQIMHDYRI